MACGGPDDDASNGQSDQGATSAEVDGAAESTDAEPEEASERTMPPANEDDSDEVSLRDAGESCIQNDLIVELAAESVLELEAQYPTAAYRNLSQQVADDDGVTPEEWWSNLFISMFVFADDGSITFPNAGQSVGGLVDSLDYDDPMADETSTSGMLIYLAHECFKSGLGVPERVSQQIANTRALDGMQTASWDDFGAQWTYHPDAGLTITYWEE